MLEITILHQRISDLLLKGGKIHILGICGIGMSAIAQHLCNSGYNVQGSDMICEGDTYDRLKMMGIKIFSGKHSSNNINGEISMIIHSTAVKEDNIEIFTAKELGIPIFNRAAILFYITQQYNTVISITGAHGKTTTTTMIGNLMYDMACDPTIITGGIMGFNNNNFYQGSRKNLMVLEADESDGTFLSLKTNIAVVTNIELEHVEYYKNFDHLIESYLAFIKGKTVKYIVACGDDFGVQKLLEQYDGITDRVFKYGMTKDNDLYPKNIRKNASSLLFDIVVVNPVLTTNIVPDGIKIYKEDDNLIIRDFQLHAYGEHNILNVMCSLLTVLLSKNFIDIDNNFLESVYRTMSTFQGVARRFNILSNTDEGIRVIDDYAHHPSEVISTISAANDISNGESRVIAVLQPHRYTRLQQFMEEFARAFDKADICIITEVYSAGEIEIPGFKGKRLVEMIQSRISNYNIKLQKCYYAADESSLIVLLQKTIQIQDIILFMGAGNITKYAKDFARSL